MSSYQFVLPKMGESISEATILSWKKKTGDSVEADEVILEVATDKVDSDVPSPVAGIIKEIKHQEGEVVQVGAVLAIIEVKEGADKNIEAKVSSVVSSKVEDEPDDQDEDELEPKEVKHKRVEDEEDDDDDEEVQKITFVEEKKPEPVLVPEAVVVEEVKPEKETKEERYYTPLVMNVARVEGVSMKELDSIKGSGAGGRVTKDDVLSYIKNRKTVPNRDKQPEEKPKTPTSKAVEASSLQDEVVEMDRMRKLIAKNMVESKRISPHVTSIIEADMTNIVNWRNKHKKIYEEKYGVKLTFMPFIVQAIAKAIMDFPLINISVEGEKIIKKSRINIGVATALPTGNLIVPVVKDADRKNLLGLAKDMDELVEKARTGKLEPEDIEGGTYTVSNIGSFGNVIGTPIIVQPQVAILAVGAIEKKPSIIETPDGDMIAIRHKMFLSHTYDHRVVDGMLGGLFVKKVAEYLAGFSGE